MPLAVCHRLFETENSEVRWVRDLMVDLLREVSSSVNSLSGGRIPPYLVPLSMVENIVQAATTTTAQTSQVHLAYSLGSALPIYVKPESLEIGFILNLPIIEKQNIYHLKSVINVGFWQNNTHVHIKTPPVLAYHEDNPTLYFIPNIDMCTLTKDIHWVCPSNPFIRDTTERLCGLRAVASLEKCMACMTIKDDVGETRVERVGARWLVNTPQQEITVSYDRHDTATRMKLPNQTVLISVPQGTTVHIEDIVLHYLNPERYEVGIEMVDAFRGHTLVLDETLRQRLLSEGKKTIQFSLDQSGIQTTVLGPVVRRSSDSWGTMSGIAFGLVLGGSIVTAGVVLILSRHIRALHSKIDSLTNIPNRFKRQPWGVLPLSPRTSEEGTE